MVSDELIDADEQRRLLDLARRALEAQVRGTTPPAVETDADDPRRGAFVSIFHRGELRGCLGRLKSNLPIRRIVFQLAQAVADSDPRFDKVTPAELPDDRIRDLGAHAASARSHPSTRSKSGVTA